MSKYHCTFQVIDFCKCFHAKIMSDSVGTTGELVLLAYITRQGAGRGGLIQIALRAKGVNLKTPTHAVEVAAELGSDLHGLAATLKMVAAELGQSRLF